MQFSRIYFVIILKCEWHWSTLSNLQYKFVCRCVYILVRILVKLHQQHRAFQSACAIFLPNFTSHCENTARRNLQSGIFTSAWNFTLSWLFFILCVILPSEWLVFYYQSSTTEFYTVFFTVYVIKFYKPQHFFSTFFLSQQRLLYNGYITFR